MHRYLILYVLFSLAGISGECRQGAGHDAGKWLRQGNSLTITGEDARLQIDFCTPGLFRVRMSWEGPAAADEHWMVTRYTWPEVPLHVDSSGSTLEIRSTALKLVIHRRPMLLEVFSADGRLLSTEAPSASGPNGPLREGKAVVCWKQMQPDEHFFGFGERMDALDQRGRVLRLEVGRGENPDHRLGAYNTLEANYAPVPFFMSTRGYGIFFHHAGTTTWDLGATRPDAYAFRADSGPLDYYFIYGRRFPAILEGYTALTGRSPLLPRYAMGLHVGTYSGGTWGHESLASAAYVLALVQRFREEGIPLDILFLDSTWRLFAAGGHGATTFEWRAGFPDPKAMFDSLYALHLHAVGLHIRPRLDNGRQLHLLRDAQQAGMTYPEAGKPGEFPNFFDSTAVDWWWEHAVMNVASVGARFLKTDEGSAFARRANESAKTGPSDTTAKGLHNIFPLAYAAAAFNGFMQYNGIRGMNQTREGYAGIQRYPYIFAGDWPSQWSYFAPVIRAGLNIGLSGVGFWAHCMGGFEQVPDPELYIRWCQFGLLSPIAMVFGMDHPGYKEPWRYGPEALRNFKAYDSLRYRLLPYLYSAAFRQHRTGMPMMSALVLSYQDDYNVYGIDDQYLLGDQMMVCPVTVMGARSRVVYLPEGNWVDYWTGERHAGKTFITVRCPLEKIPIFVKAGALIPMQPWMAYAGERPLDTLTWDVFPGGSSSEDLYQDDGISTDYLQGAYALTTLHARKSGDDIVLQLDPPRGRYHPPASAYHFRIHTRRPITVRLGTSVLPQRNDHAGMGWAYDATAGIVDIRLPAAAEKGLQLSLQLPPAAP